MTIDKTEIFQLKRMEPTTKTPYLQTYKTYRDDCLDTIDLIMCNSGYNKD